MTDDRFQSTAHSNDPNIASDTRLRIGDNRKVLPFTIPFYDDIQWPICTGENPCLEHRPMANRIPIDRNNGIAGHEAADRTGSIVGDPAELNHLFFTEG